ncbi:hypothetical protein DAMA08_009570 [Martiniozyma asiatica (nom. inval.)]|nr:hypothetical protein DAMA08_009570 [Martiniozyma asiatica]
MGEYKFQLELGSESNNFKLSSSIKRVTDIKPVEFVEALRPIDGYNKKKFKRINRSLVDLVMPKPRNKFIIYRSLVKNIIESQKILGLHDVSRIISKVRISKE